MDNAWFIPKICFILFHFVHLLHKNVQNQHIQNNILQEERFSFFNSISLFRWIGQFVSNNQTSHDDFESVPEWQFAALELLGMLDFNPPVAQWFRTHAVHGEADKYGCRIFLGISYNWNKCTVKEHASSPTIFNCSLCAAF